MCLFKVDCKINPNTVQDKKRPASLKIVFTTNSVLREADLLSSITYLERVKIEPFCYLKAIAIEHCLSLKLCTSNNFTCISAISALSS